MAETTFSSDGAIARIDLSYSASDTKPLSSRRSTGSRSQSKVAKNPWDMPSITGMPVRTPDVSEVLERFSNSRGGNGANVARPPSARPPSARPPSVRRPSAKSSVTLTPPQSPNSQLQTMGKHNSSSSISTTPIINQSKSQMITAVRRRTIQVPLPLALKHTRCPRQEQNLTDPYRVIPDLSPHPYLQMFHEQHSDYRSTQQEEKRRDRQNALKETKRNRHIERAEAFKAKAKKALANTTSTLNWATHTSRLPTPEDKEPKMFLLRNRPDTNMGAIKSRNVRLASFQKNQIEQNSQAAKATRKLELDVEKFMLDHQKIELEKIEAEKAYELKESHRKYHRELTEQVEAETQATNNFLATETQGWLATAPFPQARLDEDYNASKRAAETAAAMTNIQLVEEKKQREEDEKIEDIIKGRTMLQQMRQDDRDQTRESLMVTQSVNDTLKDSWATATMHKEHRDLESREYQRFGAPLQVLEQLDHYYGCFDLSGLGEQV